MQSCVSSLSQYQSAKTLGNGNSSNTIILENAFDKNSGPGEEIMLSYVYSRGIYEELDFGIGSGLSTGLTWGIGTYLKKALVPDKLSFNFPLVYKATGWDGISENFVEGMTGNSVSINFDRIEFSPTLLYTYNSKSKIKNTINFQLIFEKFTEDGYDNEDIQSSYYISHNWELNTNKFYFYPEIGIQNYGIGTDEFIMKFGLGISYKRID